MLQKHDSNPQDPKKMMNNARWLSLIIGAALSAFAYPFPAEILHAKENEKLTEIRTEALVAEQIDCEGGFTNDLEGKTCQGRLLLEFGDSIPTEQTVSSLTDKLDQHVLQYLPEIEFDADTIVALENLETDRLLAEEKGASLDDGFEKSIFISGLFVLGISLDAYVDRLDDGSLNKFIWLEGATYGGMGMKPNEAAMEAFDSAGRSLGATQEKMKALRERSNASPLDAAFRHLYGHDWETLHEGTQRGATVGKAGAGDFHKLIGCEIGVKGKMAVDECSGNMNMDFAMDMNTEEIVSLLSSRLEDHVKGYLPKLGLRDDVALALRELDESLKGGKEKGIIFEIWVDRVWEAKFGCKVLLSKKHGRFSKSAECDGKGTGLVGVRRQADSEELM